MLRKLLQFAQTQSASDLHLSPNRAAYIRKRGDLIPISKNIFTEDELADILLSILSPYQRQILENEHSLDFSDSVKLPDCTLRIRGHYFKTAHGITAVFRLIPHTTKTLKALHAPKIFEHFLTLKNGLLLITGATGSGKSTTLSAMIQAINETTSKHIITIEDPIEYLYHNAQSLIEQRELHRHTPSFSRALKDALRADPDIIVVGELRDKASVQLALQAAETGHLVISTLHTHSAAKSIDRLMSYFQGFETTHIRYQLAESLRAVISQKLLHLPEKSLACFEIMINNQAISHLIRENQITQIQGTIETSRQIGMQTFKQHLEFLEKSGILSDLLVEKTQNLLNPEIYS